MNTNEYKTQMRYAGIGARIVKNPTHNGAIMNGIASFLARNGWTLTSGSADGSDTFFEDGAILARGNREIYIPWDGFSGRHEPNAIIANCDLECIEIASRNHPAWDKLSNASKKLMCRNVNIILGKDLNNPVKFVIAYTERGQNIGGTAHALNIAREYGIPIVNIDAPFMRNIDTLKHELFLLRQPFETKLKELEKIEEVEQFIENQKKMRAA